MANPKINPHPNPRPGVSHRTLLISHGGAYYDDPLMCVTCSCGVTGPSISWPSFARMGDDYDPDAAREKAEAEALAEWDALWASPCVGVSRGEANGRPRRCPNPECGGDVTVVMSFDHQVWLQCARCGVSGARVHCPGLYTSEGHEEYVAAKKEARRLWNLLPRLIPAAPSSPTL